MKTMLKFAYAIVAFSIGVSVFNVDAFAQAKTKKKPAAAAAKGDPEKGKKQFQEMGCFACHKADGKGAGTGPDLSGIGKDAKWTDAKLTAVIRDPLKTLKTNKMPATGKDRLKDSDLADLLAYLHTQKN